MYVNLKGASKKNPRHVILHNDLIFQLGCMWPGDSHHWFWGHTCSWPFSAPEKLKIMNLRLWPGSLHIPPEATSWSNWLLSFPWRKNHQFPSAMNFFFFCLLQIINCLSTLLLAVFLFSLPTSTETCIFYQVSWLKSESSLIHHITSGKESNCFYIMLDLTSIKIMWSMLGFTGPDTADILSWTILCWGRLTCTLNVY